MDRPMNFSDISSIFGVFMNDMQKIVFDDEWIAKAKAISGLHMCDNSMGLKTMTEILDKMNSNIADLDDNRFWKISKFDITCDVGTNIVNISFAGFGGKRAEATVYLRDNKKPLVTNIRVSNNDISDYYTINTNVASAAPVGTGWTSNTQTYIGPGVKYSSDDDEDCDDNDSISTAINTIGKILTTSETSNCSDTYWVTDDQIPKYTTTSETLSDVLRRDLKATSGV
jgi:hypothetical protein